MPQGKQEQAEQVIPKLREVKPRLLYVRACLRLRPTGATASTTRRYGNSLPSQTLDSCGTR
jgi:hypothetical protein